MTKLFIATCLLWSGFFLVNNSAIAGKWKTTIDTDNGPYSFTVDYKVEGDKLSGTFSSDLGDLDFSGGKITGDEFEYTFDMEGYEIEHKGKLEGEKINVVWKSDALGAGEFTLTRVDE